MGPSDGFIRLHRRITEHPYWEDPERLRAWLDCLLMAAWKPHRRMVGTNQVELERGEFIASDRFLATRWGWSRGKVRRFLKAAQEAGEIEPTGDTSNGTTYLVVNYDTYQDPRPTNGTSASTTNGPPAVPPPDQREGRERTEKKGKEKKTPSGSKKKRARARQLPDDWGPNEKHQELARGLGLVMESELAHFRDHHLAKGTTMKDWDRAFNTWLRRAKQFNRNNQPSPGSEAAGVKEELPRQTEARLDQPPPEPEPRELEVDPEVKEKVLAWAKEHRKEAEELWNRAEQSVKDLADALRRRGADDRAQAMVEREFYRLAEKRAA